MCGGRLKQQILLMYVKNVLDRLSHHRPESKYMLHGYILMCSSIVSYLLQKSLTP